MHPVATTIELFGAEHVIGSYGLCLSLGIVVAAVLSVRAAQRAGMDGLAALAAVGFMAISGVLGAAVTYAAVEVMRTGSLAAATGSFGLVFFGAPVGAGVALWLVAGPLGLPLGRFADVAVAAIPAGHAVGRLGCFLAGCCYGAPWDGAFAVVAHDPMAPAAHPAVPRHPVALYEAAALIALAAVFVVVPPQRVGRGTRLAAYGACYGVVRGALEVFRGDAVRGVTSWGVSTSQVLAGVVVLVAIGFLLASARRGAPSVVR